MVLLRQQPLRGPYLRHGPQLSGSEQLVCRPKKLVPDIAQRDTVSRQAANKRSQEGTRSAQIIDCLASWRVARNPLGIDVAGRDSWLDEFITRPYMEHGVHVGVDLQRKTIGIYADPRNPEDTQRIWNGVAGYLCRLLRSRDPHLTASWA